MTQDNVLVSDQEQLLAMQNELRAKMEAAEGEMNRAVNRELGRFGEDIKKAVTNLAESKDWDIVILKETGEVLYLSERANISSLIGDEVDNSKKSSSKNDTKDDSDSN